MIYILLASVSFLAGAVVGIRDCKKKFAIPKGAVGVNADGSYIYR